MAEVPLEEKEKYIDELGEFIKSTEKQLKDICSSFGWDFTSISENNESYVICPFNEGHRVPERTIQKHLEKCEWSALGYTKNCKPLPESILPSKCPSTIKFDMQLQHKVLQAAKEKNPELNIGIDEKLIPQTSDRLMSDFTSDERKAMYEYVIANTVAPDIGEDMNNINKPEKPNQQSTTIIELLAQERNLKRRRAKHRGVHTNKKSHTEILRELIEQQMEMYKEYMSEKYGITFPDSTIENISFSDYQDEIKKSDNDRNSMKDFKLFSKYEDEQIVRKDKHDKNKSDFQEKSESKYFKDHKAKYKHSSHHKDSRDCDNRDSSRKHDYHNKIQHEQDFYDKNHDRNNSRNRNYDKKDSHNGNRSDSRDRYRDKYSSYDKMSHSESYSRKRNRSESNERKYDEKLRQNSEERSKHKKHKKDHKKKKEKSRDYDSKQKHKSSNREKHRSTS